MDRIIAQYRGLFSDLSKVYRIYGGIPSVLGSPYLHAAILISLMCSPFWWACGWWELPIAVLPNLIGFTLGGYAILLAFGDEEFKKVLSGSENSEDSLYLAASATFAHFIFIQIIALMLSIIAKSQIFSLLPSGLAEKIASILNLELLTHMLWGLVFTFFAYALTLLVAATIAIFHLTGWYDRILSAKQKIKDENPPI